MNTPQRYIPQDLSPFWNYPSGKFVLRYLDMSDAAKASFAVMIKKWARQKRLAAVPNQEIQNVLAEINPIIISGHDRPTRGRSSPTGPHAQIYGRWEHRKICKILYRILCLHKPLIREHFDMFMNMIIAITPQQAPAHIRIDNFLMSIPDRINDTTPNENITMEQLNRITTDHHINIQYETFFTRHDPNLARILGHNN